MVWRSVLVNGIDGGYASAVQCVCGKPRGRIRISIAQNTLALPIRGGANRITGALARALIGRGHDVRMVARSVGAHAHRSREEFLAACGDLGIAVREHAGADVFSIDGVEVHAVEDARKLPAVVRDRGRDADLVLVAAEDPGQALLKAAIESASGTVAYLVQTTATLPFGPSAFHASPRGKRLVEAAHAVVVTTQYLADYVRRWSDVDPLVLPLLHLAFEPTAPEVVASPHNEYVTMINPCAVKGLPMFLEIAQRRPNTRFAAVPTWGTTASDRRALAALDNITILSSTDDVDQIFRRTRVLLVPSLWDEAFGLVAVEAMLRGIPVLASRVGGLPEAMLGCDYLLPVRPIERYESRIDENGLPIPVTEPQEPAPWLAALDDLDDASRYAQASAAARSAALAFVAPLAAADTIERALRALPQR